MIRPPCLNCQNRKQMCHSNCDKYLQFKKEKQIENEKIIKIKNENSDWCAYNKTKRKSIKNNKKR